MVNLKNPRFCKKKLVFLSMLLKDRIVDFAKDFFTKGILQLNPTKLLIAKHFFMDFT
jgi:hypothetical protein